MHLLYGPRAQISTGGFNKLVCADRPKTGEIAGPTGLKAAKEGKPHAEKEETPGSVLNCFGGRPPAPPPDGGGQDARQAHNIPNPPEPAPAEADRDAAAVPGRQLDSQVALIPAKLGAAGCICKAVARIGI